jgi:hypothetical protein
MKDYINADGSISFLRLPEDLKTAMVRKMADVLQVNFIDKYEDNDDEFIRMAWEGFAKVENMCLLEYDSIHLRATITGTFSYNWFREFITEYAEPKTKRNRKRKERKNATNRSERNRRLFGPE